MNYAWHILVLISLYIILAGSLNLVTGYTGLLSLCQAAFYGVGAYATTLLMTKLHWGFFPALVAAAFLTAILSLAIAIPSLRLKGDFFVLATLGFQIIVYSVLYNWTGLTQGPYGISGIPSPRVFNLEINSPLLYLALSASVAGLCLLLLRSLLHSPFGRLLKAIREDELAAAALGKNVPALKVTAFAIAAALAAIPGGLFACYMQFIDPTSFTLTESIFILSVVIIGGAGSLLGPVVGAVFMVLLPETLRFLNISDAVAANVRQLIYGLLLILLMRFRSQGILGEYEFT